MELITVILRKLEWFFNQTQQNTLTFNREELEVLRVYLEFATQAEQPK